MKRVALAAALSAVLAGEARAAPKGSPWNAEYFGNPELVNQDGKKVRFYDDLVKDRLVVVSFVYARCTKQCGLVLANLSRTRRLLQDRVGKDVFFYSISLDPEHDTPQVLKVVADAFHAGPGWMFLTGKKDDIYALRKKFGDLSSVEAHSANVMIGNDRAGQWMPKGAIDDPRFVALAIAGMDEGAPPAEIKAAAPAQGARPDGETIFKGKCARCHGADANGGVGPSLANVTGRRERKWLVDWIRAPERLARERDATALDLLARYRDVEMPDLDVDQADAEAVVGYLEKLASKHGS